MDKEKTPLHLKPSLGLWSATAISVGAIIGGGIFVVVGIGAGLAGSALAISMIIASVIAFFTALSFAELTTWAPCEGAIYEYSRRLISPFVGFMSGWMWMISNTFGGAAVSLGFASYLAVAFPFFPEKTVAVAICLGFTLLNFVGIRQSAFINNIFVLIKLVVLFFFIIFGLFFVQIKNFSSFDPFSGGVLFGAYFIFFAYGGFARVAVIGEEVKDATSNVPKAILLSLGISTLIYVLIGVIAVGLVGPNILADSSSPLAAAINVSNNTFALDFISLGALVATASVLLTAILGVSRMAFSMARQKDLPQILSRLHRRFNTPYLSIWAVGVLMILLIIFVDLTGVVAVSTFSLLFTYIFANFSAFRLKSKKRLYPRFVNILGLVSCLILFSVIFFVSQVAWVTGIICLSIGALYYFLRNRLKKEIV